MALNLKKTSAIDSLNMTPIIDVVFLLLIFFILATKFEAEERELSVTLPQASEALPMTQKPKQLFINIDTNGRYVVNRETMTPVNLLAYLQQASASNPGRQSVVIRADGKCDFQFVAMAMNLCLKANIRDYRVATAEPLPSAR